MPYFFKANGVISWCNRIYYRQQICRVFNCLFSVDKQSLICSSIASKAILIIVCVSCFFICNQIHFQTVLHGKQTVSFDIFKKLRIRPSQIIFEFILFFRQCQTRTELLCYLTLLRYTLARNYSRSDLHLGYHVYKS